MFLQKGSISFEGFPNQLNERPIGSMGRGFRRWDLSCFCVRLFGGKFKCSQGISSRACGVRMPRAAFMSLGAF